MNDRKGKKGLSPVVATVMLISIVVVLGIIVFLWARSFIGESVTKMGYSADQACNEISIDAVYNKDSGELEITNNGGIPVYSFELKKISEGNVDREVIDDNELRLLAGKSIIIPVTGDYDSIDIYPVILGETKSGGKLYTCKNKFVAGE